MTFPNLKIKICFYFEKSSPWTMPLITSTLDTLSTTPTVASKVASFPLFSSRHIQQQRRTCLYESSEGREFYSKQERITNHNSTAVATTTTTVVNALWLVVGLDVASVTNSVFWSSRFFLEKQHDNTSDNSQSNHEIQILLTQLVPSCSTTTLSLHHQQQQSYNIL